MVATNRNLGFRAWACLLVCVWLGSTASFGSEDLFEIHVRPTLIKHCIACHGAGKREGDLRLDHWQGLSEGGDSGPVLVPGKPGESLLVEAIKHESLEMPPEYQLDEQTIAGIAAWIKEGAKWPEQAVLKAAEPITAADRQWWCFQPMVDFPVPEISDDQWCQNEIDRFILKRLQENGIQPSPPAGSATLRRRLSYDLIGMPTVAIGDDEASVDALIDRLLESKAYGENQARIWLDLVRYADSDGYRADFARPQARLYRDYVIASFNQDKPYDRFVMEQLAGDEIDPGNREALIGTMYLRHWIYEHNQRDVETQWQEILSDITETTADVFLAQGLKCAKCHDHKFDPILQRDYFRMKAFFAAFQPREDQPIADLETRRKYLADDEKWASKTESLRRQLHAIEHPVLLKHATKEGFDKFIDEIKLMVKKLPEDRTPYEQQIASLAERQFALHPEKLPEWLDEETEAKRQALRKQLAEFAAIKPKPLPTLAFAVSDVASEAPPISIIDGPDQPVEPGFLTIFDSAPAVVAKVDPVLRSTGRRTTLANWIASADNPLTARVIVNRVWQQHFGQGLVQTVNDFGHLGTQPSHPELLDWLALRFIEDGWSLKKLHRRIVSSATYQQTSRRPADPPIIAVDPENHLLWRMNSKRLTGEQVVDTLLQASGEVKAKKRAIYLPVRRNKLDPMLAAFDFPDRIRSVGRRHQTTTSTQALLMKNGDWVRQRAGAMFNKHRALADSDLVQACYAKLFGRPATSEEVFLAGRFVKQYQELLSAESDDATETSKPGTPTGQIDDGTTGQNAGTAQDAAQKATQDAGLATKPATAVSEPKKDTPESAAKTPVADNAKPDPKASDRDRARTELIHAFMNSNELIYVD